jgi:hypothetical protein
MRLDYSVYFWSAIFHTDCLVSGPSAIILDRRESVAVQVASIEPDEQNKVARRRVTLGLRSSACAEVERSA